VGLLLIVLLLHMLPADSEPGTQEALSTAAGTDEQGLGTYLYKNAAATPAADVRATPAVGQGLS
jgi:hypothetical protein